MNALVVQNPHHKCDWEKTVCDKPIITLDMIVLITDTDLILYLLSWFLILLMSIFSIIMSIIKAINDESQEMTLLIHFL